MAAFTEFGAWPFTADGSKGSSPEGSGFHRTMQSPPPGQPPGNDNPTRASYSAFDEAYTFFNAMLFGGRLPSCLITFQRRRCYGYFAQKRFVSADGVMVTDEIALNPRYFTRGTREVLSVLVHEMAHLAQFHFGKPGRGSYHNRAFAILMFSVGLVCSRTGKPGGKEIGNSMSHYILDDGPFDRACAVLLERGWVIPYADAPPSAADARAAAATAQKKRASKTRYSCLCFARNHVWGRPGLRLLCRDCDGAFEPDEE